MIGLKINNYEIKSLLGEGGMGAVYLAIHPFLGRRAAIKILRKDLAANEQAVARFMNEAKAANAIRHPNIIDVIDVGVLDGETVYLMMELLEGESLAARIAREHVIPVLEALELASQAASALGASHAQGIVHRDLKPDNLFVVPDPTSPGAERLKILDFGIAKLRREMSGGAAKTSTGTLMGTPAYMSPEQCRGVPSEIDHRTDVYALGVILYEMLTGAPPFVSEGWGDIVMSHLSVEPRPPREVNPEIPEAVEAVILHALIKKKTERYESMAHLADALAAVTAELAPAPAPGARGRTQGGARLRTQGVPRARTEGGHRSRGDERGGPRSETSTGTRKMPSVQTTLRGSSGEIESAADAPDGDLAPRPSGSKKLVFGAVGGAVVLGGVLAIVFMRGPTPPIEVGGSGGATVAGPSGTSGSGTGGPTDQTGQTGKADKNGQRPEQGAGVATGAAGHAGGQDNPNADEPGSKDKADKAGGKGDKATEQTTQNGADDPKDPRDPKDPTGKKKIRPVVPQTKRPSTPQPGRPLEF